MRFSQSASHYTEPEISRMMRDAREIPGLLSMAAGFSDTRILPRELVTEAWKVIGRTHPIPDELQYGTTVGRSKLRELILDSLRKHPGESLPGIGTDQVMITNGSQQALYLAAQTLGNPGDRILVEAPTYFVFLEALRGLDILPISIPESSPGTIDEEAFTHLLQEEKHKPGRLIGVYLVSWFSNPSSRSRSIEFKRSLARCLESWDDPLPILEDGAYRDLWFEEPWPVPSVLSLPEFENFPACYFGTFSKSMASGLKTGFAISNRQEWLQRMLRFKGHQDFGSSHTNQVLIETILQLPELADYQKAKRKHYQKKAALLDQVLGEGGLDSTLGWNWESPGGGLLLWLEAPEKIDTRRGSPFYQHALEEGVFAVPGDLCFAAGTPHHFLRLSYGLLTESELEEAAHRFVRAAERSAG